MKHINLTKLNRDGLAEYMVTQESNNFGDQILTMKRLVCVYDDTYLKKVTMYKPVAYTARGEGDWMQLADMKQWALELNRQGVL